MKRRLIAVTLVLALGGCGIAARVNLRNEMEASKAAYKTCLAQHPQGVPACEASRRAFEADLFVYRATRPVVVSTPVYGSPARPDWDVQMEAQRMQDFSMQSQANFWNMVGAMNGLPH